MDAVETAIGIKGNNINTLGSDLDDNLNKLIDRLDHIGERIRTEDVYQRQMELALTINRLVSQKKTEYMIKIFYFRLGFYISKVLFSEMDKFEFLTRTYSRVTNSHVSRP